MGARHARRRARARANLTRRRPLRRESPGRTWHRKERRGTLPREVFESTAPVLSIASSVPDQPPCRRLRGTCRADQSATRTTCSPRSVIRVRRAGAPAAAYPLPKASAPGTPPSDRPARRGPELDRRGFAADPEPNRGPVGQDEHGEELVDLPARRPCPSSAPAPPRFRVPRVRTLRPVSRPPHAAMVDRVVPPARRLDENAAACRPFLVDGRSPASARRADASTCQRPPRAVRSAPAARARRPPRRGRATVRVVGEPRQQVHRGCPLLSTSRPFRDRHRPGPRPSTRAVAGVSRVTMTGTRRRERAAPTRVDRVHPSQAVQYGPRTRLRDALSATSAIQRRQRDSHSGPDSAVRHPGRG